jgi:hypothetical protein
MSVEGADAHAGRARDGLEACLRTTCAENHFGRFEHPLAISKRIDARLSCLFLFIWLPHADLSDARP